MRRLLLLSILTFCPGLVCAQKTAPSTPPQNAAPAGFRALAKQAEEARQQNRTADAIPLYAKALKINPAWKDGWWILGTLYYQQDLYAEGRDAFRRLAALDPGTVAVYSMLGLCEFQTKDYPQALTHLERAQSLGLPQGEQLTEVVQYHLALLLTRSQEFEEAGEILSRFARLGRQDPQFVEAFGIAALRKPLLPSEVPPGERELIMDTGRAIYDATARRVNDAQTEFKSLLENYPKQSNLHFLYGSFLLQNEPDAGLDQMKQELEISPHHLPSLVSIAAEYLRRKEYQTGLPFAEKAVSTAPQSFAAHTVLGRLLSEGDIDQSRGTAELEQAVKLAPGSPQSRFALATAYAKVGRKAEATRERSEFLKLQNLAKEKTIEQ